MTRCVSSELAIPTDPPLIAPTGVSANDQAPSVFVSVLMAYLTKRRLRIFDKKRYAFYSSVTRARIAIEVPIAITRNRMTIAKSPTNLMSTRIPNRIIKNPKKEI
jgi:hypothetical protein